MGVLPISEAGLRMFVLIDPDGNLLLKVTPCDAEAGPILASRLSVERPDVVAHVTARPPTGGLFQLGRVLISTLGLL